MVPLIKIRFCSNSDVIRVSRRAVIPGRVSPTRIAPKTEDAYVALMHIVPHLSRDFHASSPSRTNATPFSSNRSSSIYRPTLNRIPTQSPRPKNLSLLRLHSWLLRCPDSRSARSASLQCFFPQASTSTCSTFFCKIRADDLVTYSTGLV